MTLRGLAPVGGGRRRRGVLGRFESPVTRATAGVREVSPPREKLPFREPLKTRGEIERIAELERLLAEPMPQQERLPFEQELTVLRGLPVLQEEFQQVQLKIREIDLTQAFRNFYQDIEMSEATVQTLLATAEESPESFLRDIEQVGRTPESEDLLRILGATPEDIELIFTSPEVIEMAGGFEPQQIFATVDGIRQPVFITPSGVAYDTEGFRVGSYDSLAKEFNELPAESKAKDLWDAAHLSAVSIWHRSKQYFVSALPQFLFRDMTDLERAIQGDAWADVTDARNKVLRDKFRATYAKNQREFDEFVEKNPQLQPSRKYQEGALENNELFKDPWYYGYEIASAIPFMVGIMGTTLVTTALTGNPIIGLAAGAALATPSQSQDVYEAILENGGTEEQAAALAIPIGVAIAAVETLGDLPLLKAVVPQFFRFFRKEATEAIAKRTAISLAKKGIVTAGKVELAETLEEVVQGAMHNTAVKVVNEHQDIFEGLADTAIRAAIASAPFALIGGGASVRIEARKVFKEDLKEQWDREVNKGLEEGLDKGQAEIQAQEVITETPEGERIINKIFEQKQEAVPVEPEVIPEVVPEAVRPPTALIKPEIPAEIPEVPVVEGVAKKGTDVQEAIPPEVINETTPVTVDDTLTVHDLNVIDRVRPTRFVFDKMGLFDIWQSAFEAETLKAEEQVAFSKELNKHAKAVGKDTVRRELVWEFVNNSNQEVFNQLTFEEKRAALWWKRTADNWADRLNIPQDQRIKDYIPHIFDEQAKQDKDLIVDASISMMFSDKIRDRVKMPFLEERLGKVNGLIKDPFLAAQAYQNVALKKFYYEPILQKLKLVSEHKDAQGNFTTPEFARNYLKDYSKRMTGEPSSIDREINKALTDMANKVRGLPGGEVLANFLDRGNPSGMAAYNLTSALYVMWLGFKPTTAIRNLSQHGLIIADVDSIQDFGNGIRLRFTKEGRAALEESLVWRSRRGAFIESIDSSMASKWSDSVRETALFMFRKADEQNVKDAFLSGYAEAKRLYPDADRSWWIKRGDEVAADTQYLYTKMNSLAISQNGPGKVLSMLTTWAINWLELMNKFVRGKQSRTYIDLVKQGEGKFALKEKNWLQSRKSLLVYMAIVGLAYAIKEQDWNKVKTFEYTGFTSINTFSNLIGGDFPALQLPGAVADLVTGTLLKDERKTKTALNELKRSFSILNQVERVASGERDWLSLLFYLEGKNYQVRQLKEDWEDNWESYDDLTDPLIRAKKYPTLNENTARKRWREQNPKIEAQMFVTNRLGTLSSEEARQEVLRLIGKHNIDTDVINGYEKIFGVDTTIELNKFQKRIGNLEKLKIDEEAKYFTTANFLTELNGAVKTNGRDKVERDGHAFSVFALGQQDSWQPYEDADPKTGGRLLIRQQFPDVEASLYMFGKISAFENPQSAVILLGWMDKYNIPPQAIKAFNENPDRYDELFTQKFELETKNFDLTTQYENYSNSEAPNYIEDKEERKEAREKFKEDNPEWIADQRRIEAIDNDASPEFIEKWAERGKIIDEFGASSSESKVWLLDNPETNQWALDNELLTDDGSDWNEDVLRLNSKWRKQDEEYAGFGDKDSRNYIKDEDARRETRESYLKSNPEYSDDIRRRQMHSFDAPDEIVEDYVSYGKVIDKFSSNSAEANLFRYNNPELSEFGEDKETLDWEPVDKSKVPIWQIDVQYAKEDAEYQAILDKYEGKEETEKTEAYLYPFGVPSPYALKRYERQALEADFPKEHIPTYIDWYTKTALNKPDNWSDVSGTDLWYEDDWFLIANQEFYQTMRDKGIFTERRDYREVPTREVFDKYLEYLKEPEGKPRKDFRWELWVSGDKAMENWLIDKGYTPIVEQAEADVERKLKTIGRDESKFEILKALSGILGEEAVAFLAPMSVQEILDGLPKSARERLVERFAEKLTPSERFRLEAWKRQRAIAPTLREIERKLAELLTKQ